MSGPADFIQTLVHKLETGNTAIWLKRGLSVVAIGGVTILYMVHFRGLATSQAMDQAQIGRHIASGHGWKTSFVRPRAIAQLQAHGKSVQQRIWQDTYNAPLPPLVDAVALRPVKRFWHMRPEDLVYMGDRAIVIMSTLFFFASVAVLFLIARRLFDQRLALLACALVLVCDAMWQYSLSGLPQMLMLFLFNATVYALIRAIEARQRGGRVGVWLAAAGAGFGFLALSHALTIFIFLGAFAICVLYFQPRGWAAGVMLATFLIIYTPWLIRNYIVCGSPAGIAPYSILDDIGHTEAGWMRKVDLDAEGVGPTAIVGKIGSNVISQTGQVYGYLGWSIVALMFFASLLHAFKKPETGVTRWFILLMWVGAVVGMGIGGIKEEQGFAANQLHLIFVPIMTCYGLGFLLVQWNRLGIEFRIARIGFITLLFLICGFPMLAELVGMLLGPPKPSVRWPPYVPSYIAVLNTWMKPNEAIASDMPWAISWYADRPSVWVPDTIRIFADMNDYNVLGMPINGLYLTPISGSRNTYRDIMMGEYRDWSGVIQRNVNFEKFPLKWATLLGLENECIFFSDHDRQKLTR